MCSLVNFPPLVHFGQVNVCEVEGKVQTLPFDSVGNVEVYTNAVASLPRVNVAQEIGTSTFSRQDGEGVFVPTGDSLLKQVVCTWYEAGILNALYAACRERDIHGSGLISKCAQWIVSTVDFISRLRDKFHPHLREKGENLTAVVAQCRDWSISPIRCIDWHPHSSKFAIAACNDSVRVYSVDSSLVPILKCQEQTAVSCLAWRPYSSSEIAVGCQTGVFVWTVDPTSVVARPSMSCAQILRRAGHSPVTSVAWTKEGDLLVSASAAETTMYVWDTAQQRSAPLRRYGGGGVCLVAWAPQGERLFAATAGDIFRVWCTKKWLPERWSTLSGRVQSACWSPCGSVLLFATTAEPVVYALMFVGNASASCKEEIRETKAVIDLSVVDISKDGERAGGIVSNMTWDRRGLHLAVVFRESNVIAIFRTDLGISFNISPCCFVNGLPGEIPCNVAFQKNFEEGSMLTIAWSSGRLQYFPIICSDFDLESRVLTHSKSASSLSKSGFLRTL